MSSRWQARYNDVRNRKRKSEREAAAAWFEDEVSVLASGHDVDVDLGQRLLAEAFQNTGIDKATDEVTLDALRAQDVSHLEGPAVSQQEENTAETLIVDADCNPRTRTESEVHGKHFLNFYYSDDDFSDSEFPDSAFSSCVANENAGITYDDVDTSSFNASGSSAIRNELVDWTLKYNITHSAVDGLLKILRKNGHESLPKRATTLLNTPQGISKRMRALGSGMFWYNGILNSLNALFRPCMSTNGPGNVNFVVLDLFVDGLSPYKNPSKKTSLWPIAGRIICDKIKTNPFIIALWCGSNKEPDDIDEFLREFVDECKQLMAGFCYDGVPYKLKVRNLIGDAPARALLKKVCPHNSSVCCERCDLRCTRFRNRMVFDANKVGDPRTDETFCERVDEEYHTGSSPLESILNMVTQIPLDPMHLLHLGVMRRILKMLLEPKASEIKIKPALVQTLNSFIAKFGKFFPSEFHGGHRPLSDWRTYKAKDNKMFLNYSGILIFWQLANLASDYKNVYECYLLVCCSSRILSDPNLCQAYVGDADCLLKSFVSYSASVFGEHFVVYNIHHLRHLADECRRHGILDNFSAELYESSLGKMKKDLRAPGRTLPQIIARTCERQVRDSARITQLIENGITEEQEASLSRIHYEVNCSDGLVGEMFQRYNLGFSIVVSSSAVHDCCCLSKDGEIIVVDNIVKCKDGAIYFVGRRFQEKVPFFYYPFDSGLVGVHKVRCLDRTRYHWNVKDIVKKCVLLPLPRGTAEEESFNSLESRDTSIAITMLHSQFIADNED